MAVKKISRPLITVYIVNHNYENYLEQSIYSVLSQSYKNFELLIIDDGSKDKSKKIIDSFDDIKITKKIFNKNIGLNKSNNVALNAAKGKYIVRLDADDYFHKDALTIFVNKINKDPKLSLIYPDYFLIDKYGYKISRIRREDFNKNVKILDLPAHGACTMFKVSSLKKIGGYDGNFNCQDGYDIWLKMINKYKISNINTPLFFYRQHSSNLTNNEKKILFTRAEIIKKRVKSLKLGFKDTLAIIPIKDANFNRTLNPFIKIQNKSLIEWAVSEVSKSSYVSKTVISTDSNEVSNYIEKKGGVILEKRNSNNSHNLDKDIYEILKKKKYKNYINIIVVFIEYPLRSKIYIDKAINSLRLFKADVVECVRPENRLIYYHNGKGLKLLKPNRFLKSERDQIYIRTGGLIAFNLKKFLKNRKIYDGNNKIGHIVIDKESSLSIKSLLDLSNINL